MPVARRTAIALLAVLAGVNAAENPGVPAVPQGADHPGSAAGQRLVPQMPQMMQRAQQGFYEVETLICSPGDPISLANWAELGAQGFHVVGSTTGADGKQILFLERPASPGKDLRLPTVVEQSSPLAGAVRAKLRAIMADRLQQGRAAQPAAPGIPGPAPSSGPVGTLTPLEPAAPGQPKK